MDRGFEDSVGKGDHGPLSSESDSEPRSACCLCRCQGNVQSVIRPAMWVPGLRTPHYYTERWEIGTNMRVCTSEIVSAVSRLNRQTNGRSDDGVSYDVNIVEESFLQIFVYTRFNSLYVVEFRFSIPAAANQLADDEERKELANKKRGSVIAEVRSFSTGLLPLCFPFALIFNIILFPIPYYDFRKSRLWLHKIREALGLEVLVTSAKRAC